MTAEQLNIKISLDIKDVANKAKKVKQEFSGMADKVKQSLPKIGTESKKAASSLDEVSRASDRVKENIEDIGEEAKDSLGIVTSKSREIASALKNIGGRDTSIFGKNATEETEQASNNLAEMQGVLENIAGLNFLSTFSGMFSGVKKSISETFKARKELRQLQKDIKNTANEMLKLHKEISRAMGSLDDLDNAGLDNLEKDIESATKKIVEMRTKAENLDVSQHKLKKSTDNLKDSVGSLITKFISLGVAATGVFSVINAFNVSELGKQISVNAQRTGMSAQKYQEWSYVLERAGVEAEEITEVIKTLTEAQVDVLSGSEDMIKAFNQLGMSAAEVASMSQQELFERTVAALQNIENTTTRTAIAYQLFSEDASKLTTVLRLSNQETQQLISTYNQLGGAMSQELLTYSNMLQSSLVNLRAAWQGLKNTLAEAVLPVVITVVNWLVKAIAVVNLFLKTIFGIEGTPALDNGFSTGFNNGAASVGGYTDAVEGAQKATEKLKRTVMGFDELNIVSVPTSGSGASGSTGDVGAGGIDIPNLGGGAGGLADALSPENLGLDKWKEFFEKFKTEFQIISGLLAGLGVASLLDSLGQAIGLGEKFHSVMTTIKKLSGTVITVVLQYTLLNEFLDNYIDGEGFKEYIKAALVAGLGTFVLYSMWGTGGLVLGLGVTAVAAIKTVIENGGITNLESAIVAFTGVAAAIGAIKKAWDMVKGLGIASKIGSVVGAMSSGPILAVSGIVGGIASVVVFLAKNWDEVTQAIKNFFKENIVPKLEGIKDSLENMRKSLGPVGDAIEKVVNKIGELFKSVDWIEGIGKVFEVVGGIIFGVVSGVIATAINMLVGFIEHVIDVIEGIVKIVEGVVKAVVKLFQGDLKGALDAVGLICEGIVKAFLGMVDATVGLVIDFVKGIIDWFTELWDVLVGHSIVPDTVEAIIEWFWKLPKEAMKAVTELVNKVIKAFKDWWENIKSWFAANVQPRFTKDYWLNKLDTIRQAAVTKLNAAKDAASTFWNNLKSWFASNIQPRLTKDYWLAKLDTIRAAASNKLNAAKDVASSVWSSVKSWFAANVAPKFTSSYWSTKFDTIRQGASSKLEAVKSLITSYWNSIKSWFNGNVNSKFTVTFWKNKFGTIKDAAKSVFNGIISIVETAINSIIKKLNTVSFSIPSWVPKIGGNKFGISLKEVKIPRLATGGIATRSTLANIGERGTEAVLPLTGSQGLAWMDRLADKLASRMGGGSTRVVLQVDGRELGWATIENINAITKQTGGLQLAL